MPLTVRTIVTAAIPTLAALFGIFWFRRKKKPPAIEGPNLSKEENSVAAKEEIVSVVDKVQVCNSTPHVLVTQPSQPTPQEELFDITEALEKAVSESIAEDPAGETHGESDSEEESVESVVTAIEASNSANAAAPVNESDVGVIEDAATSSGSELNTPSPCDNIDKQVVVNEAVVELKSAPVETEHIEKIEVESNRSVITPKEPNSSSSSSRNNDDDIDEATGNSALTNGVNDEEVEENDSCGEVEKIGVTESQESHLSNGKLENGEPEAEVTGTSEETADSKSLSWSETIELSENNNVDKTEEETTLDPYQTENCVKVTDSDESNNKKPSATAKSPVSASKSQGIESTTASSKYQSTKQLDKPAAGATSKSPKAIENRKSPRSQPSSRGKAESRGKAHHQSGFHKKGKHSETAKPFTKEELEENGDIVNVNGEDAGWGSQAEAQPNGNSDSHSEISVDSGKASSVSETPSASSPNNLPDFVVYEFDFPTDYAGRLIGRQGKNVNQLKARTGAEISLKKKHFSRDYQICSVEGTQSQVHAAIDMMKQRFPARQFPGITWEQLNVIETPILPPEIMQLSLPEGVSVDVIVSSVVDANHVFVQQPTHPTYSSLEKLNYCMNVCYTQDTIVPQLPRPIDPGIICAAPMYQGWYRAQVASYDEESDECDVKFVDYGGYMRMKSSVLRQIRSDFTTLPFQATECYMAHVIPLSDEDAFAPEASVLLESMVQNQLLQAQILTHEEDGVPYIQLYKIQGDKVFFINRELVNQNVARWTEMTS